MIVRPARPTDAEGLTDLGNAVGSEPEGWLVTTNGWRGAADERRYLRAIRRYPNAAVYVAEDEGEIVGRLSVARDQHPASSHVADVGLMVAASHRRRGIGTALLDAAVQWGRGAGVRHGGSGGRGQHQAFDVDVRVAAELELEIAGAGVLFRVRHPALAFDRLFKKEE